MKRPSKNGMLAAEDPGSASAGQRSSTAAGRVEKDVYLDFTEILVTPVSPFGSGLTITVVVGPPVFGQRVLPTSTVHRILLQFWVCQEQAKRRNKQSNTNQSKDSQSLSTRSFKWERL
jgi:hypothetical protein